MNKETVRQIYANAKQLKFMKSRANRKTFMGGRGSGKTTTLGYTGGMMFENLPRRKSF
jgi:ABC-type Fe3+/spermidine/putrescine transport system ATPase subunit